jgi:2'-5' RNA ligase
MHLTVKFLGRLPVETFEALRRALARPLGLDGPLQIGPAGFGAFPSPRRARVMWAGLSGDVAGLARAALVVEARAEALGIPREARPFHPHLTLARARDPRGIQRVERAIDVEGGYRGPAFTVHELVLYESRLHPHGPEYLRRLTIAL